jgi:hypothetical protein
LTDWDEAVLSFNGGRLGDEASLYGMILSEKRVDRQLGTEVV